MSIISIGTITITIAMLGGYLMIHESVDYFTEKITDKVEISVFIKDGTDKVKIDNIVSDAVELQNIKEIKYKSKEEAFREFTEDPEMKSVLEAFEANPLPDSIIVRLDEYTRESMNEAAEFFMAKEGVEDVQFGAEEIENLINIINVVKLIAMSAGIIFIIASILVVSNIIKLTVYNRRQDIYVFKMIGASSSFIRMPFIAEGLIHGFLGGVLGWAVIYGVANLLIIEVRKETGIDMSGLYFLGPEYLKLRFLVYAAGAGTLLGFLGSVFSQGRTFK